MLSAMGVQLMAEADDLSDDGSEDEVIIAAPEAETQPHDWATLPSLLSTPADEPLQLVSRRLSRPLTIYRALVRLELIPTSAPLSIHLLGADGREGRGAAATTEAFGPLCTLLKGQCPEVRLLLCGPNCSESDFSAMESQWGKPEAPAAGTPRLSIEYSTALYHEHAAAGRSFQAPQLAVAFNAGVWGYATWADSVKTLHAAGAPLLITSYNQAEAEDDEEALQAMGVAWAWPPACNPWRSLIPEPRKGTFAPQCENWWTQCVL